VFSLLIARAEQLARADYVQYVRMFWRAVVWSARARARKRDKEDGKGKAGLGAGRSHRIKHQVS